MLMQRYVTRKHTNTVWSNILWKKPEHALGSSWFAEYIEEIADMRDGAFIIDESYMAASNTDWKLSPLENSCLRQSRHLGMDLYFISINFRDLNTSVRRCADEVWVMHKIGALSWYSRWRPEDMDEDGHPKRRIMCLGRVYFWHKKRIHALYDDKQLLLDALKKRSPKTWRKNEWRDE